MALSFSLFLLFYKKFETYTIRNYLIFTFQIIKHPPPPFANAPPISQGGMHYCSFQHFCHPEISRRTSTHSHILTFSHSHILYLPLHSAQHINISAGNIAINTN